MVACPPLNGQIYKGNQNCWMLFGIKSHSYYRDQSIYHIVKKWDQRNVVTGRIDGWPLLKGPLLRRSQLYLLNRSQQLNCKNDFNSRQLTEALPALTVPSFLKTGGSLAICSMVTPGRGCSSVSKTTSPRNVKRDQHVAGFLQGLLALNILAYKVVLILNSFSDLQ